QSLGGHYRFAMAFRAEPLRGPERPCPASLTKQREQERMLEQNPSAINWIAPISIPAEPTAPPISCWSRLAALGDLSLSSITQPPTYKLLGVPVSGTIIGLMVIIIVAVCLVSFVGHALAQQRDRHHHNNHSAH